MPLGLWCDRPRMAFLSTSNLQFNPENDDCPGTPVRNQFKVTLQFPNRWLNWPFPPEALRQEIVCSASIARASSIHGCIFYATTCSMSHLNG